MCAFINKKKGTNFLKNMHFGGKNQIFGFLKFLRILLYDIVGAIGFLEAIDID